MQEIRRAPDRRQTRLAGFARRLMHEIARNVPFLVPKARGGIHHMLFAVVLVGLALWIRLTIAPIEQGLQYLTFFPAVTLAAVVGGFRTGMLVTAIGMLLATYIFTPPYYSFSTEVLARSFWSNTVFLIDGIVVSYLVETMHRHGQDYRRERETGQAIATRNAMLSKIVDASPVPKLLHDDRQNIILVNAAFEHTFGYAKEDLPTVADYLQKLDPDPTYARWAADEVPTPSATERRNAGSPSTLEFRLRCKNGEIKTALATIRFLDESPGDLCLVVLYDITERKRMEDALRAGEREFRQLAARIEAARESERKHIAREIHDELGQVLSALRMGVSLLRVKHGNARPELAASARELMALVDRTIQTVRDVSSRLRPSALDMGVVPALEWLLEDYRKHYDLQCELRTSERDIALDEERATAIFRIAQEALTNVVRHAGARRVDVALTQADGELTLTVADDGKGFDPASRRVDSHGLLGIRERAEAMGGRLRIDSTPQQGTTLEMRMPVSRDKAGGSDGTQSLMT